MAVIPSFNEEGNIERVLAELKELTLDDYAIDWVVIDDGSADNTRQKALEHGANVISFPFNMGIGIAVQTGFQYSIKNGAEFVVQIDGDGQHIPSEISKLLVPIFNGEADVVIGTRFIENTQRGIRSTTILRWFAGRFLAFVISFLTGQKLTDTTSGFRIYSRKAADYIATHYPDDYPEVEILVLLCKANFKIKEVPVNMRERKYGVSSINWSRSIYYVFKVIFASLMDKVRK